MKNVEKDKSDKMTEVTNLGLDYENLVKYESRSKNLPSLLNLECIDKNYWFEARRSWSSGSASH